ncbi:diaminobutyrate--2-oxoglutarate transaminase, partial [Mycobacterium kansasii]
PAFVTAKHAIDEFWSDDALEKETLRKGAHIEKRFEELCTEFPEQLSHRGRGMVQGLVFADADKAGEVCAAAYEQGLLA